MLSSLGFKFVSVIGWYAKRQGEHEKRGDVAWRGVIRFFRVLAPRLIIVGDNGIVGQYIFLI